MAENDITSPSPEILQRALAYAENLATIEEKMGEIAAGAEKQLFIQKQAASEAEAELRRLTEAQVLGADRIAKLQEESALLEEGEGTQKRRAEIDKEILAIRGDIAAANSKNLDQEREALDLLKAQIAAQEESLQLSQDLEQTTKLTAEALTGIGDSWKRSATGAFLNKMQTDGFAAALGDVGKGLKENMKLENIAGSIIMGFIQQTAKAVLALDNARSGFAKAMGTGTSYNSVITEVHTSTRNMGIDASEAAASTQALAENMAGFGTMSNAAKVELAGFNATMMELGVSGAEGAKLLENSTKVMGMTRGESKAMAADLSALSTELGISFGQLTSDFNSVMGDLAVYGKEAPKVFKKLAGASAALGISVDSLVGSMKDLDTITGAATAAGKLNAALGGQFFDTNELLNASYEERVVLLKKGIDASGKDFDSMSRAEKQMLANSAGLKDVGELAKFMRTDMNNLTDSMDKAGDASGSMEDMEQKAKDSQSATDKLAQAMENLAVALEPLLEVIHFIADGFKAFMSIPVVPWIMGLGGALFFAAKAFLSVKATALAFTGAVVPAGTAAAGAGTAMGTGLAGGITAVGSAAASVAGGLFALAGAFVLIALGVFIAAYGIAQLVKAFSGFSAAEILAISVALAVFGKTMVVMMTTLAGMTPITAVAAKGLLIFGIVMALVGFALLLAAFAFTLLVDGFMLLLPHLGSFLLFAGVLLLLAVAGLLMLPGGIFAMIGLILMAVGLIALGLALKFISSDDLHSLGMMMQGLGELAKHAGAGMSEAVPMVRELMNMLLDMEIQILSGLHVFKALGDAFWGLAMAANSSITLAVGITLIALAIESIPREKATLFISLLDKVAATTDAAVERVSALAWAIWELGFALDNLSSFKMFEFSMMVQHVGDMAQKTETASPEVAEQLVIAAQEYSEIKYNYLSYIFDDPFTKMLQAAGSASAGSSGGGSAFRGDDGGSVVVLELDGRELGRTVEKVLGKRNSLKAIT